MSEITNNSSQHRKEIYANRMLQIRQIMSFAELENFINTHKFSGNEAVPIYYLIRKLTKLNRHVSLLNIDYSFVLLCDNFIHYEFICKF